MPAFSGSIAFGLVYIPVTLTAAARPKDPGFNLLHKKTGARIRYVKTAEGVGEVGSADIVKGYEYEKGKYVVFDDKELEKLRSTADRQIVISAFVAAGEVDPLYWEKSYYVSPTGGEKAFSLLAAAMEKTGTAGIAKAVIGKKETLAMLRTDKGRMYLTTLFFADEIASAPAAMPEPTGSAAELELAERLIRNMTAAFRPEAYKDEYRERLAEAIEDKAAGKAIAGKKTKAPGKVTDLMDALRKSVEQSGRGRPAKKAALKLVK